MKKGMFCLLPLLLFAQAATSTPSPLPDRSTMLKTVDTVGVRDTSVVSRERQKDVKTIVVAKPIAQPPRAGRNNRPNASRRTLIRRR